MCNVLLPERFEFGTGQATERKSFWKDTAGMSNVSNGTQGPQSFVLVPKTTW
jgi:hypothetical protein